jgi:hypothetical protein
MRRRRLPIPQHEFGFTPDTFNLIQDIALDGERIARDRAELEQSKRLADAGQARLFPQPSTLDSQPSHD